MTKEQGRVAAAASLVSAAIGGGEVDRVPAAGTSDCVAADAGALTAVELDESVPAAKVVVAWGLVTNHPPNPRAASAAMTARASSKGFFELTGRVGGATLEATGEGEGPGPVAGIGVVVAGEIQAAPQSSQNP